MQISELKLAKDLIRKPSVTPKDAGAINLLAKNLRSIGFNCKIINFKNVKNLYAKLKIFSKLLLCRTYRCGTARGFKTLEY